MESYSSYYDTELLAAMAAGDRQAFTELYNRYWVSLYSEAYKRLKSRQQSEDIVQEVFTALWLKRSELNIRNAAAYFHTAVRYRVFNLVERDVVHESFYNVFDQLAELPDDSTQNKLISEELLKLVESFSQTLPEKRREIFLLRLRDQLSIKEISSRMDIAPKTVQNQLTIAMQSFRPHVAPAILALLSSSV